MDDIYDEDDTFNPAEWLKAIGVGDEAIKILMDAAPSLRAEAHAIDGLQLALGRRLMPYKAMLGARKFRDWVAAVLEMDCDEAVAHTKWAERIAKA